jgi:lysophospholipase L1-like esterase
VISPPTALGPLRPLRVHVLGSSAAVLVEPRHGPRDGGTYGEQLAGLLHARGIATSVTHAGTWFGMVRQAVRRYERDVRDHFPDVLVVNYGMAECQSNALPYALVRHATTWDQSSRTLARAYRAHLLPRVWRLLRTYQRWAGRLDRALTHRQSPRRFVRDLTKVVEMARKDCGCLVLLLDVDPPGSRVEHWLPGTTARAQRYSALVGQVAASFDDDVRLVPAGAALTDPDRLLPDGLHRTPEGHRQTAQLLEEQIARWLEAA